MSFCYAGVCPSDIIRSSRATFSECHWLHPDINKMALHPNRAPAFAVLRVNTRSNAILYSHLVWLTNRYYIFIAQTSITFSAFFLFIYFHGPDEDIEGLINRGRKVRCLWVYAPDSAPCSAMQGILWELQRKVRQFHQSAETFWLHNGSFIDRNFVKFSDWKPPMRLPWSSLERLHFC